jgi:hypothetical protein
MSSPGSAGLRETRMTINFELPNFQLTNFQLTNFQLWQSRQSDSRELVPVSREHNDPSLLLCNPWPRAGDVDAV